MQSGSLNYANDATKRNENNKRNNNNRPNRVTKLNEHVRSQQLPIVFNIRKKKNIQRKQKIVLRVGPSGRIETE